MSVISKWLYKVLLIVGSVLWFGSWCWRACCVIFSCVFLVLCDLCLGYQKPYAYVSVIVNGMCG